MAPVYKIDPGAIGPDILKLAVTTLQNGGVIVYPTETFYALGVDCQNFLALERLVKIKNRPAASPFPLIISHIEEMYRLAAPASLSAHAAPLAEKFWPGPLTLVLAAGPHLHPSLCSAPTAAAKRAGVAMRLSSHPFARALTRTLNRAITATSANLRAAPAVNAAADLSPVLLKQVDMVFDAGPCPGGLPSTVLDLRSGPPFKVLRPGPITVASNFF